jgi:hypothetical protein
MEEEKNMITEKRFVLDSKYLKTPYHIQSIFLIFFILATFDVGDIVWGIFYTLSVLWLFHAFIQRKYFEIEVPLYQIREKDANSKN